MATVALVGPSWPFRGGIARATTALAAELAARSSLAAFLTPRRQYPRLLYPGGADVDPDACARLEEADRCFGVLEPWTWPSPLRRLGRVDATALVVPYWTWAWAPLQRVLLAGSRRPSVAVVHNPMDHDAGYLARRAARAVLSRCRGYLCHAEAVASSVRRTYPSRPVAVHPLPPEGLPAVDRNAARRELGIGDETVVFLCFGLIRPYKGVDVLLDAFAALPEEAPVMLLLAGEPWGEERRRISLRLAGPRLAGRVLARLEWLPEGEATSWFAAADVAVLPYRSATGSAVAARAVGAGLPIVGSAVGGLAEVVSEGINGLLVPPSDPRALTAALADVLDAEFRGALRRGAAEATVRWTWSSYADALLRVVDEALADAGVRL